MWGSLCIISFLFALFLVPETKGLTLEQVDRMLEETTPWTSAAWVPHDTFAHEMGLTEKGIDLVAGEIGTGNVEHVDQGTQEKAVV